MLHLCLYIMLFLYLVSVLFKSSSSFTTVLLQEIDFLVHDVNDSVGYFVTSFCRKVKIKKMVDSCSIEISAVEEFQTTYLDMSERLTAG